MPTSFLSLRLPNSDLERLNFLSKTTNRPKSFYVKEAIHQHLKTLEATYLPEEGRRHVSMKIKHTEDLDMGYKAMAADLAREAEAYEWCNGLSQDMVNEAR